MKLNVAHDRAILEDAEDALLVGLSRGGDEQAVRVLVQRYNRRLYRIARAVLRDDSEAEDVVQEAHVKAFVSLDRFRGDAAFGTWITRIALNTALERLRRRRPTVAIEQSDLEEAVSAEVIPFRPAQLNPEQAMDRLQVRELLEAAVEELPDTFRVVFVLREIEQMSIEETAAQLGLKAATVKTRLHRARKLLQAGLARRAAPTLPDIFPFAGRRCARMADRVVAARRSRRQ